MPLLADKRITVRNLRYDPDTDTETEIYTVLDGVSVHAKTVAAAADDGLHACCVVQIRIFSADTLSAPQSTPDAPLPAGDTYLEPAAWAGADAAEAAKTAEAAAPAAAEPRYGKVTTASLNIRSGAGTDYDKVGSLKAGKIVTILGEANGWYQIESGYVSADYVTIVDAAEATRASKGQEIADYALQFVGYPYVYGGSSPKGFDCSGLTSYVYRQFGYSINRTASGQLDNGTAVSMS